MFFRCCDLLCWLSVHRTEMVSICVRLLLASSLWIMPHTGAAGAAGAAAMTSSSTEMFNVSRPGVQTDDRVPLTAAGASRSRQRRAISPREINALLDYHNRVRSQVFPLAANMEFMVRICQAMQKRVVVVGPFTITQKTLHYIYIIS